MTILCTKFEGFNIYAPENKLNHLKTEQWWTVSEIQRVFKIGYYASLHLIKYAQSEGVLKQRTRRHGINQWESINERVVQTKA